MIDLPIERNSVFLRIKKFNKFVSTSFKIGIIVRKNRILKTPGSYEQCL